MFSSNYENAVILLKSASFKFENASNIDELFYEKFSLDIGISA